MICWFPRHSMNEQRVMGVLSHERFSVEDFRLRWQAARISAVKGALGASANSAVSDTSEEELLALVPEKDRETVLRKIFDHSRALGVSVVKFLGLSWEISDLEEVLGRMNLPCLSGKWSPTNVARVLERAGCEQVKRLGSFACDYWREAADGLVMGVGEVERYARHASVGHGDAACIDVFFDDSLGASGEKPRHAAVPEKIKQGLREIHARFNLLKATLTLEGLSEGVLYYRLESSEGPLCGSNGRLMHESFAREVKNRFPGLMLQDASPLAVYGEGTK